MYLCIKLVPDVGSLINTYIDQFFNSIFLKKYILIIRYLLCAMCLVAVFVDLIKFRNGEVVN